MARSTLSTDLEFHILHNYPWAKLPSNIKQSLYNSQKEWEKCVFDYSVRNQLRYRGNIVRQVRRDERKYYEELLQYSKQHLMLFPYHLSDVIVKGLRITPFSYYCSIMENIMSNERSYDSLPNFTAADCLRLLAVGRNQYIELMNTCRSSKKFFRKKPVRDLLPTKPATLKVLEPWWIVQIGYVTEDDIRMCSNAEHQAIDSVIDKGPVEAGIMDLKVVQGLYTKGLIFIDVPIADGDYIVVPPLENFVMNRVLGDYFETLMYKIFVSIDENTTIAELANVLQIDLQLVKNAVSVYIRLGFAHKKGAEMDESKLHTSWTAKVNSLTMKRYGSREDLLTLDLNNLPEKSNSVTSSNSPTSDSQETNGELLTPTPAESSGGASKRIAFLFDSTLTAFLMMGNLSPGLKSHAVTMFEVGKLADESLDSFLGELEKVDSVAEGEAQRYFDHAITLRDTILFLRYNRDLGIEPDQVPAKGLDLLRCESLNSLDSAACGRVLQKNYSLIVSMAPLSNEIRPVTSCCPPHFGPAVPEVNSVWFKLFIYDQVKSGPPSLLLVKGTRLRWLPKIFEDYERLMITTWGHDPGIVPVSNVLLALNDALSHSAVLVQAHGVHTEGDVVYIPFPLDCKYGQPFSEDNMEAHPTIQNLAKCLDLEHTCGFISMLKPAVSKQAANARRRTISANFGMPSPAQNDPRSFSPLIVINDADSSTDSASDEQNEEDGADPMSFSSVDDMVMVGKEKKEETQDDSADKWLPLDLSYGLPLFDGDLSKQVYQKISSKGLCHDDSLKLLVHSSRKLTLRLLDFISQHQDATLFQESASELNSFSPQGLGSSASVIPYPTRNLCFYNGTLGVWDGR